MNDSDNEQKWKDLALRPWVSRRGLEITDRNGDATHVRADVEATAAVLARSAVRWEKDALDKPVLPGDKNLIVFRLRGHPWTIVVDRIDTAQELSQTLQTEVIRYMVSDTCGAIGYWFYDQGEELESFCGSEGDDINAFESRLRTVSEDERANIWEMVERFFVWRGAYEPGIAYEYFFRDSGERTSRPSLLIPGAAPARNDPVIRNPGFVHCIGAEHVVSKPDFERVDFIVLRESPRKSGSILLG